MQRRSSPTHYICGRVIFALAGWLWFPAEARRQRRAMRATTRYGGIKVNTPQYLEEQIFSAL
jgi:hypothetical protein